MNMDHEMKRRNFLKKSALGLLGAGLLSSNTKTLSAQEEKKEAPAELPKIKSYRTLGRTGFKVSDIGSGGPRVEGVLSALLDAGVNYIDTAESYGRGQSETATGNVMKSRDRKSVFITSKLSIKPDDTKDSILERSRKCLERLQTEYLDCMMMHNPSKLEILKSEAFHEAMKQLKTEGKIRFIGFSNHGSQWDDKVEPMENMCLAAAADGRFDVMLFVYNFVQKETGERILKACQEKNIGVTLMKTNPVGGYLEMKENLEKLQKEGKTVPAYFNDLLPRLKAIADSAETFVKANNLTNPAEIRKGAIKFVLGNPNVHTVCCSCDSFEDVETYLKLSGMTLTAGEAKKLSLFKEGCSHLYCRHACGICESGCPSRVPVNTIMRYNHYFEAQGREKYAMLKYAELTTPHADKCWNCPGTCESACPYHVPIHALMMMAHQRLTLA